MLNINDECLYQWDTLSLETALKEYNGTMIVIFHDKPFLKAVVTSTWEFKKEAEAKYKIIL